MADDARFGRRAHRMRGVRAVLMPLPAAHRVDQGLAEGWIVHSDVAKRLPQADPEWVTALDSLHLAAAQRAGAPALRMVAFDVRLAHTARSLGWTVMGA